VSAIDYSPLLGDGLAVAGRLERPREAGALRVGFSSVRGEPSLRLGRSGGGDEDSAAAGADASLRTLRR
jgi:hypothetical protein